MKFLRRPFLSLLTLSCLLAGVLAGSAPLASAAVDVTPSELQNSASLLKPDGSSLGTMTGFSSFYYRMQSTVSGGILTRYQALLLSDPWLSKGLPELQLLTLAYVDQDAADAAFESYSSSSRFNAEDLMLISESDHAFFYTRTESGSAVDLFNSVSTNAESFHWLEKNGNVLIQSSLYLGEGSIHEDTLSDFLALDPSEIVAALASAVSSEKISLGLLFPPENPLFSSQTESSSLPLDDSLFLPSNGSLSLDIYVSDPSSAEGTVLDSSGLLSASDGDFYLYINKEGKLLAGLYAPYYDADCAQVAGWYRVGSSTALYPYEWNHVVLRFGVGGFGMQLNDSAEVYCSVSQGRSSNTLYLGDYPSDSMSEGMLGVVDHVSATSSLDALGRTIDLVLENQLFLDFAPRDEDFAVFEALKEAHVFLGSDGQLNPDASLNRIAMVKVILRAFGLGSSTSSVSFTDVASDAWFQKYLAKAVEIGMVEGRDDGSFGPAAPVTRAEFFTMLERLDSDFDGDTGQNYLDLDEDAWYLNGATYAFEKGFVTGDYFYPIQMVTRREAARVLYQLMN